MTDTIFVVDTSSSDYLSCKIGCCAFDDFLEPLNRTVLLVRCEDAESVLHQYLDCEQEVLERFRSDDCGSYSLKPTIAAAYIRKMLAYEWSAYEILRDTIDTST